MRLFVGRDAQILALQERLATGLAGRGSVCFVTGEPGAGKSSLLAEFARRARDAYPTLLVASGACDAYTGVGDPYLPFREILRELTGSNEPAATGATEPAGKLRGAWRFAIDAVRDNGPDLIDIFLPGGAILTRLGMNVVQRTERGRRLVGAAARANSGPTARALTQENIFEQYTQVLVALAAARPLLLIVDDLHWVDSGSAGLLFHLSRRLARAPILLVGAYRRAELSAASEGGAHALAGILIELQRAHGDLEVRLDDRGAREFVDALADDQGADLDGKFREALTRQSSGNALFAVELLRSLEDSGVLRRDSCGKLQQVAAPAWESLPSRVVGVIESRIRRLSADQRTVLAAASVQGEVFLADVLAEVLAMDRRAVIRELSGPLQREHELVAAIGLQQAGRNSLAAYKFRHNLVQDYLYRSLDEIELAEFHRETGLALERLLGEDDTAAVRIGSQFLRAGEWEKAIGYSLRAGENAIRQLAPNEAIRHFELALELSRTKRSPAGPEVIDVTSVAEKLADQLLLVARFDDATKRYRESLDRASTRVNRARLVSRLALVPERQSRYAESLALLDEAMTALGDEEAPDQIAWWQQWIEIQLARCGIHYWRSDTDAMAAVEETLRPVVERVGDAIQRAVFHKEQARRRLRLSRYQPDAATREAARASAECVAGRTVGPVEAECLFVHAFTELWAGEFLPAAKRLRELLDSVRRSGDVTQQLRSLTYLALVHRRLGQTEPVAKLNAEGRELSGLKGQEAYAAMMLAQDAWVAWRSGNPTDARVLNERALAMWNERAPRYPFKFPGLWLAAALSLEEGDARAAAAHALRTMEPSQVRPPAAIEAQLARLVAASDSGDSGRISGEMQCAVALARQASLI